MPKSKDPKLSRAGVSAYNKPKRTPNHKTKKFVVVAKQGDQTKTIRFGDLFTGNSHKMPNGSLHSGKVHGKTSVPLFHFKDLSTTAKKKVKK